MFPWIHHSSKKTVKTSSTSKLQKKKKKKHDAPKQSTDGEPTPCCGKQVQRVVQLVKKITKKKKSTKRKQGTRKKCIKALEKFYFLRSKQTTSDNMKTNKSEARKRRSPSDVEFDSKRRKNKSALTYTKDSQSLHNLTKTAYLLADRDEYINMHRERYAESRNIQPDLEKLAYHTRKQVATELIIDIHNIQDDDALTFMVQTDDKMSAFHTHKQPTSKQMRDVENLKHQTDMPYMVPVNANIIANAQLQYTSNHISDESHFEQLRYKEFKDYVSDMESESESDINDREDYYINQQHRSTLIRSEATAFGVYNDFIEKKQVLSDLNQHYGGMESDKYVDRSSIQFDKGHASAVIALYESESESDTPVTEVQYSSNEICVKNGIPFMQSEYVFKRNKKANQEVKLFLFGNDDNQLYTRAALTKFQNYEISTMDFKIVRFLRRDFHDIVEVFETLEPYQGKMNDLIQIMEQFELETSQQIHFDISLQPSSASLSANKWTDKVNSQAAKKSERADFTSFAEDRNKSVGNTSIDKTNTAMLKGATRISQIPPKTESLENKLSTKELALDSDIRKSISKSRKVLPTHRTTEPMLTSRRKMVDAKVKTTSKYKTPKFNIFTTLDNDKTGISTVLKDDIVRQAMYDWFNNESKIQFQRPSIPWPSMHPLLPYKLRYLDEGLVNTPIVKTTSSPNDSTDENE